MPDLYKQLQDYAVAYAQAYGTEEQIMDLIPAILATFLNGDRAFAQSRRTGQR